MTSLLVSYDNNKHKYFAAGIRSNLNNISNGYRISYEDKMRIQTLHEQGLGAKAIRSRYPAKQWSLNTLKTICRRTTKTGSAVTRQSGSGRPKSARTAQNIVSSRNVTVEIRPVSTVPGYVVYHQTRDVSGQSLFS